MLLAKVLGSMNAPITGFVTALSGNIRNLLYVLNAIGEKKERVSHVRANNLKKQTNELEDITMNKDQIMEAIENMTVLELSELVKAMEEKFGVSAAAPAVAVAAAAAPAEEAAAEKTEFDVVLKEALIRRSRLSKRFAKRPAWA